MKKTILEDKVYCYEDSIENLEELIKTINELDQIEKDYNSSSWVEWKIGDFVCGYNKKYEAKTIKNLEEPVRSKMNFVYDTIQKSFYSVCKDYGFSIKDNTEPIFHPLFNVSRYEVGGGLGPHFDQGYDGNTLKYTLVAYLNDDYQGGEISFKLSHYVNPDELGDVDDDYESAKIQKHFDFGLKPKAGSIIIFPSLPPYRHTAHSVKSGSKMMVQSHWLYNNTEKGE